MKAPEAVLKCPCYISNSLLKSKQESANSSFNRPDSKCFQPCRLGSFCCKWSALPLQHESSLRWHRKGALIQLCSNTALFTRLSNVLVLAYRSSLANLWVTNVKNDLYQATSVSLPSPSMPMINEKPTKLESCVSQALTPLSAADDW